MDTKSLFNILSMIILYINILMSYEQNITNEELPQKLRKLDTYGKAILYFSSQGVKFVFQVTTIPFNDFNIYLRADSNIYNLSESDFTMTEINNTKITTESEDYYPIYVKYSLYNYKKAEIILEFKKKPTSLKALFANCNANKISFEDFDSSDVTDMSLMFYFCSYLTYLDLSSFDTSKVQNMMLMFQFSISLKLLNIKNFNTSQVTSMYGMFHHCRSLITLDVTNFDTSKVSTMSLMFSDCVNLKSIDLSNFDTSNVVSMFRMFSYCTNLISLDLGYFDSSNNYDFKYMFIEDSNLKELNLINFSVNNVSDNIYEKYLYLVDYLRKCVYNNYNSTIAKYIYKDCSELIGFKFCGDCIESTETYCIKNIIVGKNGTVDTGKEITKKFFYVEEEKNLNKKDRACYWLKNKLDENYILKSNLGTYFELKCHESCKTCNLDNIIKCNECEEGYYPSKNEKNEKYNECYNNLTKPNNYFFRNNSYLPCDISCSQCDEESNLCISCSENYFSLKNESENYLKKCYKCDKNCLSCNDFSNETSQNCIECKDILYHSINGNCVLKNYYPEIISKNYLNKTLEDIDNETINNILENYILYEYSFFNHITQYKIDNGSITIFNLGKNHTKISDIISSDLKISNLELDNLYSKLSEKENINADLIFLQMDFNDNKKDINYLIYNPNTKKYIDLSNYLNITIGINRRLNMKVSDIKMFEDIQKYGYNILDLKDKFYNDKCVSYSNEDGSDIILKDRIDDIYNYDILQLYENCDYENFNKNNQNIACQIKIKNNLLTNATYFEIDKEKYKTNNNLNTETNFHVFKCVNELFSVDGFTNNIGNYLLLICLFIIIVVILISFKKLIDDKNNVLDGLIKENYKSESNDLCLVDSRRKICNLPRTSSKIRLPPITKKLSKNGQIEKEGKIKNFDSLNDEELNDLKLGDASKLDKRSFCQYYLYLIKKSNPILFIFHQNYDSQRMKTIILINNFCLNICVNQLFFTQNIIHKIYSNNNNYKFSAQLTHIILSTIISSVIITIIKLIFLTDRAVNEFKRSLLYIKREEAEKKLNKLMTQIRIKNKIFCILAIIFTIIFWYYISCFCAVYKNTQIALIKNTLITFIITLIYPFIVSLIPSFIRIMTLRNADKFGSPNSIIIVIYKISQVIAFLL